MGSREGRGWQGGNFGAWQADQLCFNQQKPLYSGVLLFATTPVSLSIPVLTLLPPPPPSSLPACPPLLQQRFIGITPPKGSGSPEGQGGTPAGTRGQTSPSRRRQASSPGNTPNVDQDRCEGECGRCHCSVFTPFKRISGLLATHLPCSQAHQSLLQLPPSATPLPYPTQGSICRLTWTPARNILSPLPPAPSTHLLPPPLDFLTHVPHTGLSACVLSWTPACHAVCPTPSCSNVWTASRAGCRGGDC